VRDLQELVYFDNKTLHDETLQKLKSIKEFSPEEYNQKQTREYIIKKLDLLEKDSWIKIQKSIIKTLRKNCFVIVKGLPFDEHNRFFISLLSCIGEPVKHNSRVPVIIRELSPRDGPKPFENFPHTDSPHWPIQNDLTALHCIKKDYGGGGLSRIVPVDNVLEKLSQDGYDNIINKFREREYPFLLDRDFGDKGIHFQRILNSTKFNGNYYDLLRFCKVDSLQCVEKFELHDQKEQMDNMETFEKAAVKLGEQTQFAVEEGDLLIFDNKRALHSKTTASPNSDRLLKKIKANIDRRRMYSED